MTKSVNELDRDSFLSFLQVPKRAKAPFERNSGLTYCNISHRRFQQNHRLAKRIIRRNSINDNTSQQRPSVTEDLPRSAVIRDTILPFHNE